MKIVDAVQILVIFDSSGELTEQLALAAAVGAVQGRASIRIRCLPTPEEAATLGNERLTRLQREYVLPTSDDALWADAIIIAMHNKIAGLEAEPDVAMDYGRRAAVATRAFKTA